MVTPKSRFPVSAHPPRAIGCRDESLSESQPLEIFPISMEYFNPPPGKGNAACFDSEYIKFAFGDCVLGADSGGAFDAFEPGQRRLVRENRGCEPGIGSSRRRAARAIAGVMKSPRGGAVFDTNTRSARRREFNEDFVGVPVKAGKINCTSTAVL